MRLCVARIRGKIRVLQSAGMTTIISHSLLFCAFVLAGFDAFPQKRKLSPSTVAVPLAALRFLHIKKLKKNWSIAESPYPKKPRRLPTISPKKVAQLLQAARTSPSPKAP